MLLLLVILQFQLKVQYMCICTQLHVVTCVHNYVCIHACSNVNSAIKHCCTKVKYYICSYICSYVCSTLNMDEHTYVLPKSSTYYLTEYSTVLFLNQARTSCRPACAWFLKVAVKWIFHRNNCLLNTVETKLFTPLNSR